MKIITIFFSFIIIYDCFCIYQLTKNKDITYGKCSKFIRNNSKSTIRNEIECMSGREFEIFCEWLFKKMGYKTILTPSNNDEGKDVIAEKGNEKIYVECKRYTDKATVTENFMIGREICQKLIGSMVSDNIKKGIIFTTGNIHQNAWNYIVKLEENTDVKLDIWDLDYIMYQISKLQGDDILKLKNRFECNKI